MSDPGYRKDRIERLLQEVRYEVERGVLGREIPETLGFEFVIPVSKEGDDWCVQFVVRMKPMPRWQIASDTRKLKLISGDQT